MKAILVCTVLLALSASPCRVASGAEAPDDKLDAKIPKADPKKYQFVRDAKDWANPYLIVRADGVEVISKSLAKGRQLVPTKELAKTLAALPVSAWPYGRVVAAQEAALRSPGDDQPIAQNKEAVKSLLKALEVEVLWWPSA